MHPLLHEWLRSGDIEPGQENYQYAAVVLLVLGARDERTPATQYLANHVEHMSPLWDNLDLNSAIAFGNIMDSNGHLRSVVHTPT